MARGAARALDREPSGSLLLHAADEIGVIHSGTRAEPRL
jgi:hypothetical protein